MNKKIEAIKASIMMLAQEEFGLIDQSQLARFERAALAQAKNIVVAIEEIDAQAAEQVS